MPLAIESSWALDHPGGNLPTVVASPSVPKRGDKLRWRLHQFNQYAFTRDRELIIALGVNEADVVASSAFADAAGSKTHAPRHKPAYGAWQIIDPQTNVIERRAVHRGLFRRVQRLHQIDFDFEYTRSHGADVFVDILALANELASDLQSEHIDPQPTKPRFVGSTDGDLLDA